MVVSGIREYVVEKDCKSGRFRLGVVDKDTRLVVSEVLYNGTCWEIDHKSSDILYKGVLQKSGGIRCGHRRDLYMYSKECLWKLLKKMTQSTVKKQDLVCQDRPTYTTHLSRLMYGASKNSIL